jgi:hypothetical protein
MRLVYDSSIQHVRNNSSSLVATNIQRLNAGCKDSILPASFLIRGVKLLASFSISNITPPFRDVCPRTLPSLRPYIENACVYITQLL